MSAELDLANDRALQRGLAKAIARSWKDEAFRELLLTNSNEALLELGVLVPPGVVIRVVPDDIVELPLPEDESAWDHAAAAAALQRLLGLSAP